jgi:hypothetical protein
MARTPQKPAAETVLPVLPPMPGWARNEASTSAQPPVTDTEADTEADTGAAFQAGAALAALDLRMRADAPFAGVWRRRLALKAAAANLVAHALRADQGARARADRRLRHRDRLAVPAFPRAFTAGPASSSLWPLERHDVVLRLRAEITRAHACTQHIGQRAHITPSTIAASSTTQARRNSSGWYCLRLVLLM